MHHFKAPHDLFQNAPRYESYLEDVVIPEPENLRDQPAERFGSAASRGFGSGLAKGHESWQLGRRLVIDASLSEDDYLTANYQRYLKRYLRCVKGVDDNIKRLIEFLREIDELENTIIVYTTDQGFFLGEHDLMDKRWMYEEAMRMPLIIYCPSRFGGGLSNDWIINNTDFAPTILDLAGVEAPSYMQGRSFAAALRAEQRPSDWRTATYYRYWMHMAHKLRVPAHFGIRTERYKLIFFYGATTDGENRTPVGWELYDLENDPSEMENQYSNPEYRAVVTSLKTELRRLRLSLNETDAKYPQLQDLIESHWDD
ncbi:MAG: sulfatase/phosphatase domain-containing protein, partial [Planctomycetota bacterium]